MAKYFKIATAQVRSLAYKNCYDWTLVKYDDIRGLCFYIIGNKINVSKLSDVLSIHKLITSQKPYSVQPVQIAEFYGNQLAIIDYASENLTQSKLIDKEIQEASLPYVKQWAGYILKNVNDLNFLK